MVGFRVSGLAKVLENPKTLKPWGTCCDATRCRPLWSQELGFTLLADLNQGSTAIGFDRPLFVFQRPARPQLKPAQVTSPVAAEHGDSELPSIEDELPSIEDEPAVAERTSSKGRGKHAKRRQHNPEDLLAHV